MSTKGKKLKKALLAIGCTILGLILILCIAIWCLWGNELRSVASIKEIASNNPGHKDGFVYEMTIYGDYFFDDFLEQGGVSSDSELISFITGKITKGIIPMNIGESEIACSSFTAATSDGDRVFGRNYDFKMTNTCIVHTNPGHGRHSSVSTVDLEFISIDNETGINGMLDKILCLAAPYVPLDGMNDAGVSCGIYMTYQGKDTVATNQQTSKPDITSTTMLRMILDYADSVEEAIELVSRYDLHDSASTSYHYMVADATGRSAILEWVAGTDLTDNDGSKRVLKVTYNTDDAAMGTDAYQCVTNFIVAPDYYDSDEDKLGFDRYEFLRTSLSSTNGIAADDNAAMELLSGVGRRHWNNDDSNAVTVHSVIYNLTDLTMIWVSNEHYGEDAFTVTYHLKK